MNVRKCETRWKGGQPDDLRQMQKLHPAEHLRWRLPVQGEIYRRHRVRGLAGRRHQVLRRPGWTALHRFLRGSVTSGHI